MTAADLVQIAHRRRDSCPQCGDASGVYADPAGFGVECQACADWDTALAAVRRILAVVSPYEGRLPGDVRAELSEWRKAVREALL